LVHPKSFRHKAAALFIPFPFVLEPILSRMGAYGFWLRGFMPVLKFPHQQEKSQDDYQNSNAVFARIHRLNFK